MEEKNRQAVVDPDEVVSIIDENEERFAFRHGRSTIWYRRLGPEGHRIIAELSEGGDGKFDNQAFQRTVFERCMLGWENVVHPVTGEQIPFSVEMAIRLPDAIKTIFIDEKITGGRIPRESLLFYSELKNLSGTASLK